MVVQPGVINQQVQDIAGQEGFFWPPDPSSAAFCTVGGNLAYNSAGPRAVKYGTPRENTLGLKAVTGNGKTIRTGVFTTKGVVGYDLTRLLIGSEGTLGIITEAILKLTPLPESKRTLRAVYSGIFAASKAVSQIMAQPTIPCALEFMDANALEIIRKHSSVELPANAAALLLIDVDGRVLIAKRPEGKTLAGLWEFPGGKVEPGERPEAALIRELSEELGVEVSESCLAPFVFASHAYDSFHLLMPLYLCRRWNGVVAAREHDALAWVRPDRLSDYPMPPADEPLVAWLRDLL